MPRAAVYVSLEGVLATRGIAGGLGFPRTRLISLVNTLTRDYDIVVWTSRPESERNVLEKWMLENGVPFSALLFNKPNYELFLCDRALAPDFLFLLSKFLRRARRG